MSDQCDISVVVCTHNRAELLRDALQSLTKLDTDNRFQYEVLVVDNASTDRTPDVVNEVAKNSPVSIRRVHETNKGIVFARNRGIEEARGEWIAFFDDDQLADVRWLLELRDMAEQHNVRCVGGSVKLYFPDGNAPTLSPFCRMLLGETVGMDAPCRYDCKVTPGAGNLMLHRSVFEEVGRFDERFNRRGEDTDLFLRLHRQGIDSWYTPDAVVHHHTPKERLDDQYLLSVSRMMVQGMAVDDQNRWGKYLYPVFWLARVAQGAIVLAPRFLWATLLRDKQKILAARCRLLLVAGCIRDGVQLMLPNWASQRLPSA